MKKLNVLALAIVCAFAVVFGVVTFKTNTAQAAVIEGSAPTLGKSFFKISKDGDACMIATAIQDFEFVYAVGYDFEEENVEPIAKATGEYYSAISMGDKRWTPSLIFLGEQDDDYDAATGMIVWELPYSDSTTYHFTAYALWGRKDDESGNIAHDGNKASASTYKLSEKYVLSFENGEEDLSGEDIDVTIGEAIGELPDITAKTGYTADGWKIADTLIGEDTVWRYRSDKTATAVYTANTYTLSFSDSEGSHDAVTVTYDQEIGSLPALSKTGYTGVWKIDGTVISSSTTWNYTTDKTATAVYTANTYTLSFSDSEGSHDAVTVTFDQEIGTLPALSKTGYMCAWKIDGTAISSSTTWNYTTDKTAVAEYKTTIGITSAYASVSVSDGVKNYSDGDYVLDETSLTITVTPGLNRNIDSFTVTMGGDPVTVVGDTCTIASVSGPVVINVITSVNINVYFEFANYYGGDIIGFNVYNSKTFVNEWVEASRDGYNVSAAINERYDAFKVVRFDPASVGANDLSWNVYSGWGQTDGILLVDGKYTFTIQGHDGSYFYGDWERDIDVVFEFTTYFGSEVFGFYLYNNDSGINEWKQGVVNGYTVSVAIERKYNAFKLVRINPAMLDQYGLGWDAANNSGWGQTDEIIIDSVYSTFTITNHNGAFFTGSWTE